MGIDYRVSCCPDGLMTDRRRNVTVLDCTIRDGGCTNAWRFDHDLVARVYAAVAAAGVDICEVGYWTGDGVFEPGEVGPWRFTRADDLRHILIDTPMQTAVMCDRGRISKSDLRPPSETLVDVVRMATYAQDVDEAIGFLEHAQDLGYQVFCNVMAVTVCTPQEVDAFLGKLAKSSIPSIAIVDSFGAMYPHHLRYLTRKYKNWLRPDQSVGVHLHNNQQTAFANTIAAIDEGADFVDATVFGMGRGAGNCPLELLLMYLDDPKHDVVPLLEVIEEIAELRQGLKWGYHVPYGVSGWLNQHPREAIRAMHQVPKRAVDFFLESLPEERARHHRPKTHEP